MRPRVPPGRVGIAGVGMSDVALTLPVTVPAELVDAIAALVAQRLSPGDADPWMTVAEAADRMRCKPQRIYDLRSQHRLPPDGYDGSRPLWRRSTLDAYLERGAR